MGDHETEEDLVDVDLTEIVLTEDDGYKTRRTQTPVRIIGGKEFGCFTKNNDDAIRGEIRYRIRYIQVNDLPEGINGYIRHGLVHTGMDSSKPEEEREVYVAYSAVIFEEREQEA